MRRPTVVDFNDIDLNQLAAQLKKLSRSNAAPSARYKKPSTLALSLAATIAASRVSAAAKELDGAVYDALADLKVVDDLSAFDVSCLPGEKYAESDAHDHDSARFAHDNHGRGPHYLNDPFASRFESPYARHHEDHDGHGARQHAAHAGGHSGHDAQMHGVSGGAHASHGGNSNHAGHQSHAALSVKHRHDADETHSGAHHDAGESVQHAEHSGHAAPDGAVHGVNGHSEHSAHAKHQRGDHAQGRPSLDEPRMIEHADEAHDAHNEAMAETDIEGGSEIETAHHHAHHHGAMLAEMATPAEDLSAMTAPLI